MMRVKIISPLERWLCRAVPFFLGFFDSRDSDLGVRWRDKERWRSRVAGKSQRLYEMGARERVPHSFLASPFPAEAKPHRSRLVSEWQRHRWGDRRFFLRGAWLKRRSSEGQDRCLRAEMVSLLFFVLLVSHSLYRVSYEVTVQYRYYCAIKAA